MTDGAQFLAKSRPIRHEKVSFLGRMSPEMTDFKFILSSASFGLFPVRQSGKPAAGHVEGVGG